MARDGRRTGTGNDHGTGTAGFGPLRFAIDKPKTKILRSSSTPKLMPEVPDSREYHGHSQAVGGFNHFFVPHRAPRLDDGSGPDPGDLFHSVGKGEKGI